MVDQNTSTILIKVLHETRNTGRPGIKWMATNAVSLRVMKIVG